MAILHVAVTGRDRRHLSELRDKFRVVVVGARETPIVVDAYIPADRLDWLRQKGYGVGSAPASEPETRNVIWLRDRFPNIRYLVDLHSFGETILHSWGTDENQSDDPRMNFQNPHYDAVRGRIHDNVYREYLHAADAKLATSMGKRMAHAIGRVRGREYKVMQSVGLYPAAGASDDYAYSRHLVDRRKGKIIGYTIEWGRSRASTPFHPPYDEMRKVMREVTAGLLELCASVAMESGRHRQ